MTIPPFLVSLLQLLFDLAVPSAMCTMLMAGLALRQEGGMNFEMGGRFQRWILWTVILLTLPQFLAWLAKAGINLPPQAGAVSSPWVAKMETTMTDFISQVVVAKLIPVLGAFFVLKATLDSAQGHSPIGSIIAAIFMLSISGTVKLMQGFNSGTTFPETAITALTTPLSLTGTPDEIDAQLTKTLTEFTALHVELQNSFDTAANAIKKAVKEIDERERIKKEQDKAKNKKPEAAKADEKKNTGAKEESLPSLFTAPSPSPNAVSANDAPQQTSV